MHHGERLAVVPSDTHLDAGPVPVVDDPRDLQPAHLSPDGTVLDGDLDAGIDEETDERQGLGRRLDAVGRRGDVRMQESPSVHRPHLGAVDELPGPTGEDPRQR